MFKFQDYFSSRYKGNLPNPHHQHYHRVKIRKASSKIIIPPPAMILDRDEKRKFFARDLINFWNIFEVIQNFEQKIVFFYFLGVFIINFYTF